MTLDLKTEWNGRIARVLPVGELDIATAPQLHEELLRVEQGEPLLVLLDLRGLTFMDSDGLRLILQAAMHYRKGKVGLGVIRGPEEVDRVFRLTRTEDMLVIIDDPARLLEEAGVVAEALPGAR